MSLNESNPDAIADPEAGLENAFIEEFLRARDLDVEALHALPHTEAKRILTDASVCAAAKLAEVKARAHFVQEMHTHD